MVIHLCRCHELEKQAGSGGGAVVAVHGRRWREFQQLCTAWRDSFLAQGMCTSLPNTTRTTSLQITVSARRFAVAPTCGRAALVSLKNAFTTCSCLLLDLCAPVVLNVPPNELYAMKFVKIGQQSAHTLHTSRILWFKVSTFRYLKTRAGLTTVSLDEIFFGS